MEMESSRGEFGGGPAQFLTLGEMADHVGTSKSYVSRRAREGKSVRGVPVSEMAVREGGRLAGFEVPRGALDDEPEKGRENDASDDISDEAPVTDGRENGDSDPTGETDDSSDTVPVLADAPRENPATQLVQALGVLGASVASAYVLSSMQDGGDGPGLGETDRRTIGEVAREVQAGDWPCDARFHFRIPWTNEVSGIGFTDFTVKRRLKETADSFETVSWNWSESGVGSWGGFRVRGEDVPAVARKLDAIRQTAPDKMGAVELRDVDAEPTEDGYNCFRPKPEPQTDDRAAQQQTTGQQAGAFGSTANRLVAGLGGTFLLGSLAFALLDDGQN